MKYVKWIYHLYFYLGTFMINLLKLFVKPDDKMILFISFGGRRFDDSPKAIYDQMIKDERFNDYRFIWAFIDPNGFEIEKGEKVKCDTLSYYRVALKSRVWITNSTVERGLDFKGKHTFYFNTWHGTPIKRIGSDISKENKSFKGKGQWKVDYFTCQGEYEQMIYCKAFYGLDTTIAQVIGLPRNDIYANYTNEYMLYLRKKMNIPADKRVILYAPTFREYDKSSSNEIIVSIPVQIKRWREELGDNYVLLFRAHYEVAKGLNIEDDDFVREMSEYPQLEDLMIISDLLISDYSSIFFDYSIMPKPMLAFCYDYEKYATERGMYFDIRDWLPSADNEEDLLELIKSEGVEKQIALTQKFQKKFVTSYGTAVKQSLDAIYKELSGNKFKC